ncbi:hypothetical protein HQ29_03160 [Porphyromonas canoris]|uniref:hypothetical protein n=1 Tax=Porphyromonas canoris TaxID=36875 RepID=UPI00051D466A|nr:hypothetical protein [Porphyromonas canoris]KGL52680.1 hypothetical protein HQ29_03160 [Porphyromonas canoris]
MIGLGSTPIKRGEIKTYLWEDLHEDVANFNFKLFTTEDNSASTGIKVNKLNANEVELQFVEEGKFTLVIEFEVNGKNFYLSYDLTVEN